MVKQRHYLLGGLHKHQCPERVQFDQRTPAGMAPSQRMCTRCGRVTARVDRHGLAWCGGRAPVGD